MSGEQQHGPPENSCISKPFSHLPSLVKFLQLTSLQLCLSFSSTLSPSSSLLQQQSFDLLGEVTTSSSSLHIGVSVKDAFLHVIPL